MDFNSILQGIQGLFQPKPVSPIPAGDMIANWTPRQWQDYNNQAGAPTATPTPTFTPQLHIGKAQFNTEQPTQAPVMHIRSGGIHIAPDVQKNVQAVLGAEAPPPGDYGYETQHPNFDQILATSVFPNTRPSHIPDAVAAAQTALESAYGDSPLAKNNNNYHGIMKWDSAGNRSPQSFDSASKSAMIYANTVKSILESKGYDVSKMTADEVLNALQEGNTRRYEGDNPDPKAYVRKVENLGIFKK